ncbi:MAG: PQQ-binding-like beta-propeller repeat protein [Polyangiaceae bacterium]|nr:PQQ-binding-like beta-propeller repeat protein [Polyangiaceae bacterium]
MRLRGTYASILTASALVFAACTPPSPRAAIYGGRIAVQENIRDTIHSIDGKSGKSVAMPSGGWADAPPTKDGLIFVHGDGGLAARDIVTGAVKWRVLLKMSYLANVVPTKEVVFVPFVARADLMGGTIAGWVALDRDKGTRLYDVRSDKFAPLAANDDIVATIENGELVGYATADGKERWRSSIKTDGPLLIENGRLFGRTEDKLAVFTASSGALQRRMDLGGTDAFRSFRRPFAAKGNTIAWIESDVLNVADATTGKQLWKRDDVDDLAVTSNIVVAARDDQLEGLDLATGASKWKLSIDNDACSLAADGDTVVARLDDERVAVIDAATGKRRFEFDLVAGAVLARAK